MKSRLLLASSNAGKLKEFEGLIGDAFEVVLAPHALEVIEDGETYFENALKKAMAYWAAFKTPVLSDDSGLEVDALGGRPGLYSARYGGEKIGWPERWAHLHGELAGKADWSARFRCVLCHYDGVSVPRFFQATAEGKIVAEPRGGKGFGYDPIFFSSDLGRTFGEATDAEKARVSHRALAAKVFVATKY